MVIVYLNCCQKPLYFLHQFLQPYHRRRRRQTRSLQRGIWSWPATFIQINEICSNIMVQTAPYKLGRLSSTEKSSQIKSSVKSSHQSNQVISQIKSSVKSSHQSNQVISQINVPDEGACDWVDRPILGQTSNYLSSQLFSPPILSSLGFDPLRLRPSFFSKQKISCFTVGRGGMRDWGLVRATLG